MRHRITFSVFIPAILLLLLLANSIPAAQPPQTLDALSQALPDSLDLEDRVVYVDFWASWCMPCRVSFPWMASLERRYSSEGLIIAGVNVDREHSSAQKFLDQMPVHFQIVFDSLGALAKAYDLQAMPSSFLYDREGKLRFSHTGFEPKDTLALDSTISSLLREDIDK